MSNLYEVNGVNGEYVPARKPMGKVNPLWEPAPYELGFMIAVPLRRRSGEKMRNFRNRKRRWLKKELPKWVIGYDPGTTGMDTTVVARVFYNEVALKRLLPVKNISGSFVSGVAKRP